MADKYLDKLSKLLRLAEAASTEAEAEAYQAKAQQLATQYQIDLAVARSHAAKKEEREVPVVLNVTLGESRTKGLANLVRLMSGITSANNVRMDIAHDSTYVIMYGFPSQIETVQALFGSLSVQLTAAAAKFIKGGTWKGEAEEYFDQRTWSYRTRKPHALTERLSFEAGWVGIVALRVHEASVTARKEAVAREIESAPVPTESKDSGTEIALRAVELEVREFYKSSSRARGSYRGGSYAGGASRAAGHHEGSRAQIGASKAIAR